MTLLQKRFAAIRMLQIKSDELDETWRSGCAYGLDSIVPYIAMALDIEFELYIPSAKHNINLVRLFTPYAAHVTKCADRGTPARSYRLRNILMLEKVDFLHAFVTKSTFYRSGEWMTINIASVRGIKYKLEVLPDADTLD